MNPRPIFGAIFLIVPERHHDQTLAIMQRVGRFVPTWAFATLLAMLTVGIVGDSAHVALLRICGCLASGADRGNFRKRFPTWGPFLSAVPALLFALRPKEGMIPLWVFARVSWPWQLLENNVISP